MRALRGAIRGIWGGLVLLVLVAAVPGLAWLVASYTEGVWGLGFKTIFFMVLALEGFFGLAAGLGIASEVQNSSSERLDRATQGGGS